MVHDIIIGKQSSVGRETSGTRVVPGTMITINYGDTVKASCKYDYSGPSGYFTFALQIGTWYGPIGPFQDKITWQTKNISISPGTNKTQVITFVVTQVSGLNPGNIYDMNWEIGTGDRETSGWQLIERLITDDVIKIADEASVFSNLSVSYQPA